MYNKKYLSKVLQRTRQQNVVLIQFIHFKMMTPEKVKQRVLCGERRH